MEDKMAENLVETNEQEVTVATEVVAETVIEDTALEVEPEESMDDFKDMLDMSMVRFSSGDIVEGEVIAVTDTEVIINFGYISDGVVPVTETFADFDHPLTSQYTIGDKIKAEVIKKDDGDGNVLLSLKKAQQEVVWDQLQAVLESGAIVDALVTEAVKGGLVVKVLQSRAFMPGSMVSASFIEDFTQFNGKTLQVVVKELDREKNRVIVSHREIEQKENAKKKEILFASIKKGDVFTGTVKKNMNFGSFVDIGGVDGLVHINELSWKKVNHPSDVVKEGDIVTVTVTQVDLAKQKIGLSMKDSNDDPWATTNKTLEVGKTYEGKVKRVLDFGAFVEILPGIEGLVHISQMSNERINHPSEVVKEGDVINVKVQGIDAKDKKIKLTMKLEAGEESLEDFGDLSSFQSDGNVSTDMASIFGNILKDLK